MIRAIVGAGGKTTLIHKLANEFRQSGKKCFVTTTTHMYIEPDSLLTDSADVIISKLNEAGYAFAGRPDGEKLTSLSDDTYNKICAYADEVLVEADGSKHFPLKLLADNEPVIPFNTDEIIIVCGLHALGKRASEAVFRLEAVKDNLGIAPDTIITPEIIQIILQRGYRDKLMQNYSDKKITYHIANDGSLYQRALAALLKADMDVKLLKAEWFEEKPCLFICGAGHVSKFLADIAAKIDMRVKVIDPRPEFANSERFPYAEQVICDSFDSLDKYLEADAYYAVITPGHADDFGCVNKIIRSSYRYLGMIGSRQKVAKTRLDLSAAGVSDEQLSTLHAPIGLPIGAASPAEIAISILAEIIEIKNKSACSSAQSELINSHEHGTLCIIIDKTGSTPRSIGSMMLVTKDGQIDTIGGGAIENNAIIDAREAKSPFIREYQLNNKAAENIGMICGGTNKVLFIPV